MRALCASNHFEIPLPIGRKAKEYAMSTKFLFSVAILSLSACTGSGPSGSDKSHTDSVGGDDDDVTQTHPAHSGGINVHGIFNGGPEDCQVVIDDQVVGNTDEDITGLQPGLVNLALGDPEKTTLDGSPFHITNDDKYLLGQGSATVTEGQVAPVEVTLELAAKYVCGTQSCDWPYRDGSCTGSFHTDDPQWIWVEVGNDYQLGGSENQSVASAVKMTLKDGVFTASSLDPNVVIVDLGFDPVTLSLWLIKSSDNLGFSEQFSCDLE